MTVQSILNVNYVSAPPGARKTTAALNYLATKVMQGYRGKNVGYFVYIAPTRELVKQSAMNLRRLLPADIADLMIHSMYSEGPNSDSAVVDEIYAVLDGRSISSRTPIPFTYGSVLFMTHKSFLNLRRHEKFLETTVIFDEARKWVEMVDQIKLEEGAEEFFHSLFETHSVGESDKTEFVSIVPRKISSRKMVELIENKKNAARAFSQLEKMHALLSPKQDDNVRMKVYGKLVGKGMTRTMVRITLPSHPFRGFHKVIILSADFETSQMYHLLLTEKDCKLKDVTLDFMDDYTSEGYVRSVRQIEKRYSKLVIVPLLDSDSMSSKYQIESGVILPQKNEVALKNRMDRLKVNTYVMRDVVKHKRDPSRHNGILNAAQSKLLRTFDEFGCHINIMEWMVATSRRLARAWWKKHPINDERSKALIILNKDFEHYTHSCHELNYLSLGKVEGRNDFQNSNVVAFLAAVNPEPTLLRLLNVILPDYAAEEDYVVDKAIQSLGRGNIRKHNCNDAMLAIVSTRRLAERIAARMRNQPVIEYPIMDKLGGYTLWSYREALKKENLQKSDNKDRHERYNSKPYQKEINSLRSKRWEWRKKLVDGISRDRKKEIDAKLVEIEAEISKFEALRNDASK